MIGQTVGRYRIMEFLGHGESGAVYTAEDLVRHRLVALKIIPPQLLRDPGFAGRFERELARAAALDHPSIPRIYDSGRDDQFRYVAMQLFEGTGLDERLRKGPLIPTEAVRVAAEITAALEQAHAQGLAHRDLKASHILLTPGGARLLGIGVTPGVQAAAGPGVQAPAGPMAQVAAGPMAQVAAGPAAFGAGEMAAGAAAGPAAGGPAATDRLEPGAADRLEPGDIERDLVRVGALLYEMLTGRAIRAGEAAPADLDPPSRIRSGIPASVDRVVLRALSARPEQRFTSAAELLQELRGAGTDLNAQDLTHAPLARRRRRHYGTLLPTVAAVALLILVWLLWRAVRQNLVPGP